MDGGASDGFSGAGLPPRPAVAPTRRRAFVAPHPCPTSSPLDANLPPHVGPSLGGGGGRMPSSGGGGGLPHRLPHGQPPLVPHALTFMEPRHAAIWDAGSTTASPAEVLEVTGDEFSPNHWTPEYTQPMATGSHYFSNLMTQEDDLELLNPPVATPSNGGKGVSKRGSNYTNREDIQLCKSWIHISNDPIIGNDQSGRTYWERIANDFHINKDFDFDRSPNSLEHGFGIILKECMKFQGYYDELQRRHPSGIPYQEHLLEAQARYARKANGKNCQFENCWLVLRHTEKFASTIDSNNKPTKSREPSLSRASQQDDESTTQGQESSSMPAAKKPRPPGRKQSKEKLKRNDGDDEYKDMMQTLVLMKNEEHKMKRERWDKDLMLEKRRIDSNRQRSRVD